jgi:hypothetical protein
LSDVLWVLVVGIDHRGKGAACCACLYRTLDQLDDVIRRLETGPSADTGAYAPGGRQREAALLPGRCRRSAIGRHFRVSSAMGAEITTLVAGRGLRAGLAGAVLHQFAISNRR